MGNKRPASMTGFFVGKKRGHDDTKPVNLLTEISLAGGYGHLLIVEGL